DASVAVSLFEHKTIHDGDNLGRFRAELGSLGVTQDMLKHRAGIDQETADWLSRAKDNMRPKRVKVKPNVAVIGMNRVISDSEDEYDDDDDDLDEEQDQDIVEQTPLQQHDNETHEFIRERTRTALQGLPNVDDYIVCQQDDEYIQERLRLCDQRDQTDKADYTPDFNEVELERNNNGCLERLIYARRPGNLNLWVPILTCPAARQFIESVHAELAHAGYKRTLDY
ncbi:hypothetical protein IW150_003785, partial [Coemansia sp. RSA 2607]